MNARWQERLRVIIVAARAANGGPVATCLTCSQRWPAQSHLPCLALGPDRQRGRSACNMMQHAFVVVGCCERVPMPVGAVVRAFIVLCKTEPVLEQSHGPCHAYVGEAWRGLRKMALSSVSGLNDISLRSVRAASVESAQRIGQGSFQWRSSAHGHARQTCCLAPSGIQQVLLAAVYVAVGRAQHLHTQRSCIASLCSTVR